MTDNGRLPAYQSAIPVAVDTAGGDFGLPVVIEGAVQAFRESGVRSILIGDKAAIESRLHGLGASEYPLEIQHAEEFIDSDESPARAVRRKPKSSLCLGYSLVQQGRASALISAGNSGAVMAAGRILCGSLPGIERPAIAALLPVAEQHAPSVLLDVGANVDCQARHLVQFALMGSVYCTCLFQKQRPSIGLLSNGTEAIKGTDTLRAAAEALRHVPSLHYTGYIEGRDIVSRRCDVIVCDGFVGNVLLKAMEGCVQLVFQKLVEEGRRGFFKKLGLGLSQGVYRNVFEQQFNYSSYGGAPLLGLQKLALVLHGASEQRAVKNAIESADRFAKVRLVEKLALELSAIDDLTFDYAELGLGKTLRDSLHSAASSTPAATRHLPAPQRETMEGIPDDQSSKVTH